MRAVAIISVNDARIIDAGLYAVFGEALRELVAVETAVRGDAHGVLVKDVGTARSKKRREQSRNVGKPSVEAGRVGPSLLVRLGEMCELRNRDRGLHIGEAVVVADALVLITATHPLVAKHAQSVGD